MATNVQFEKFSPLDLNEIVKIEEASFPIDAYSKKRIKSIYKNNPESFIIAKIAGRPVGYILTSVKNGWLSIDSIAVDKKHQGAGIGKMLMFFTFEKYKKKGIEKVVLEVRTTNKKAVAFYNGLGFKVAGTIDKYYLDGAAAYQMEKESL